MRNGRRYVPPDANATRLYNVLAAGDPDFTHCALDSSIIHNPNAGATARQLYRATLLKLKHLGASTEILETARHGEGTTAAADAAQSGRFDAVVAAGGDGTVHDAAEGLVGHPMPLGIIPMGTGNVFAREINIPFTPGEIAGHFSMARRAQIPVGQVNGRPFLFVIGVGFDAEAVRLFESEGSRELRSFVGHAGSRVS